MTWKGCVYSFRPEGGDGSFCLCLKERNSCNIEQLKGAELSGGAASWEQCVKNESARFN